MRTVPFWFSTKQSADTNGPFSVFAPEEKTGWNIEQAIPRTISKKVVTQLSSTNEWLTMNAEATTKGG
jgi:hypothetical protein